MRLDAADPLVLFPARIDDEHLVVDHAGGRHVERLVAHVDHLVGLGNHPAGGELGRRGQVLEVAFGRAIGDPLADRGLVLVAQPRVIEEVAVVRVGVPGGHPLRLDDFFDHRGPAGDLLVAGQGERRDLPLAVAEHAIGVHDAGDLPGVGDVAVGHRLQVAANQTAGRLGLARGHRVAGQHRVERLDQIAIGWRRFLIVLDRLEAVLVVDAAAIADHAAGVEHDHFGRALGAHRVGHDLVQILENREFDFMLAREGGDLGDRVLAVRVDAEEDDSLGPVRFGHLGQSRGVRLGQRTLGAQERQHHDLAVRVVERDRLPVKVLQGEIRDFRSDGNGLSGGRGGAREHGQCQKRGGLRSHE